MDTSAASVEYGERAGRTGVRAGLVLLAACSVGVFADRGALLAAPWSALAEVGTPFVLVAFAAGRQSSRWTLSALWGATVLSVGQTAYYVWLLLGQDVAWGTITHSYRAGAWLAAGALLGALFGALGGASRAHRKGLVRTGGWGLAVAVPLAEGVLMAKSGPSQIVAGTVLLAVAVAIGGWAVRRDRAPWPLGVVSVVAVAPAVLLAANFRHLI